MDVITRYTFLFKRLKVLHVRSTADRDDIEVDEMDGNQHMLEGREDEKNQNQHNEDNLDDELRNAEDVAEQGNDRDEDKLQRRIYMKKS